MGSAASIATARASQAEFARLMGVSRQAINALIRAQKIELGQDGKIDVELARVALANRTHPSAKTAQAAMMAAPPGMLPPPLSAAPAANDDATTSYHVAKTLREATEARIAQLKLAEMRGELIRAADARANYARRAAALRESLQQLPDRLAAVLAAETDQAAIRDTLAIEIDRVLTNATA